VRYIIALPVTISLWFLATGMVSEFLTYFEYWSNISC
jgi:hypothetical protein